MKRLFTIIALVATVLGANAQEENAFAPYWFAGVQGGLATTLNKDYKITDVMTPTATVSVGYMPIKEVGFRVSANGIWSKSGITYMNKEKDAYKYNYATGNFDVLMNLCTIFGKKDVYPVNLYLIAGMGANYKWDKSDAEEKYNTDMVKKPHLYFDRDNKTCMNFRAGLQLEANIFKNLSANIEADYNYWNAKRYKYFVHDRNQLTAQVGLTYKFGYKKQKEAEERVYATPVAAPTPAPAPTAKKEEFKPTPAPAPAVKKEEPKRLESMEKDVFFTIGKFNAAGVEANKVADAAAWLKSHPTAKAVVTGYADKGTGTAEINYKVAERRANQVADDLKAAGVPADRIVVDSKGDTVQPFAENDQNRVAIIKAQEK